MSTQYEPSLSRRDLPGNESVFWIILVPGRYVRQEKHEVDDGNSPDLRPVCDFGQQHLQKEKHIPEGYYHTSREKDKYSV